MPTEEFREMLDRDRAKVEAKELIEAAAPLLRELVNYATTALIRCLRATDRDRQGGENEDLAAFVLYEQLIEQTDAIEVLMSESCVNGAVPVLRSTFEAVLSLEYILTSYSHYVERSLAWTCGYIHRRIQKHEGLDPATTRGAERLAVMEKYFGVKLPPYDSSEAVNNLRSVLARQQFALLEADYAARRKHNPKADPEWFSLLGGPRNRRQLARLLNHEVEYLVLYGDWSDIAHGTDAAIYVGAGKLPKQPAFTALRSAQMLPNRAFLAAAFLLRGTRLLLQHFRPNEPGVRVWYLRDVKQRFDHLQRLRVNVLE